MSKGNKDRNATAKGGTGRAKDQLHSSSKPGQHQNSSGEYLLQMRHASPLGTSSHWFQMLPVIIFTAVIIAITRMASYELPMNQFFFWSGNNNLTDFFSYQKMVAILICSVLALVLLLYRVFIQAFYIKRSFTYIPIAVYTAFVLLSYLFSDYKQFALWGWQDRLEGSLVLLSYMVLLFYTINTVNSEKNVKWLLSALAVVSTVLGTLGITQALNHDFFRTTLGKKLITPSSFWPKIDTLNFTFTNQIYQTVYNINYVSFYLTLLIPIFGILFIRSVMLGKEEPIYKKILWGALFALLIFNLIGSASSGGLMGMAFVLLAAIIVLNKNIIKWIKPVAVLLMITIIIAGISYSRWMPELSGAVNSVLGKQTENSESSAEDGTVTHRIDHMITSGAAIYLGYEGKEIIFETYADDPSAVSVSDSSGNLLTLSPSASDPRIFQLQDEGYQWISLKPAVDDMGNNYIILTTEETDWDFRLTPNGPLYRTNGNKLVALHEVPAVGWENNQSFGSGRGYIWSRTIPMLKDTLVLGHGADTYCIYFPQEDYAGKYNSGTFSGSIETIVDKPHNMYFGAMIGTGGISLLALLVLWGFYLVQSFQIYRKERYTSFISFAGAGIFLGICGFLVSGLVNDSTVSVMPMFYGLLGTGIAINMMLKDQTHLTR